MTQNSFPEGVFLPLKYQYLLGVPTSYFRRSFLREAQSLECTGYNSAGVHRLYLSELNLIHGHFVRPVP